MKKNYILKSMIALLCCLFTTVSMKAEASISLSETLINLTVMFEDKIDIVVNVKATDLTEDIQITNDIEGSVGINNTPVKLTSDRFSISTNTIPATDAMSQNGYNLTITIAAPQKEETFLGYLIFTSGNVEEEIGLFWSVDDPIKVANLAELYAQENEYYSYFIESELGVSYSDNSIAYLQDATGGICIALYGESDYNRGDHYTNIFTGIYRENRLYLYLHKKEATTPKEVVPTLITVPTLKSKLNRYEACLVRINDVRFGTAADGTFATTANTVTQNGNEIQVNVFEGSNLIGATIPQAADVVGVVTSIDPLIVTMRDGKDLLAPTAIDQVEVSNRVWVACNILHIKAEAAVDVVVVDLLGKQVAAQSAVESLELALPTGLYVVKVDNQATKVIVK